MFPKVKTVAGDGMLRINLVFAVIDGLEDLDLWD